MSRILTIPYGDTGLRLRVPEEKLLNCFAPSDVAALADPKAEISRALRDPCDSPPLRELARGKKSAAVVIDDSTRAVPNALLLDALMPELEAGGMSPDRITVIAATGLHRPLTDEEFRRALGPWFGKVRAESHDAKAPDRLVPLGVTSLGTDIRVNRTFAEADLKVLTGDVEHHQFCGYSGGAKSVYPGLADAESVRRNHSRMDLPGTGPGTLDENPVRREVDEVGRMAGVDFLLSVVLNSDHHVVSVHAGNWLQAFRNACPAVDRIYRVSVPGLADLVVASPGGLPKDANLYQAQKALRVASRVVRPGGSIVLAAACPEGSGSDLFEQWMEEAFTPEEIVVRIRQSFVMGGHKAYQIVRELSRAHVYLYSAIPPGKVRSWFMRPLRDWTDIERLVDQAGVVTVLPQASSTLAEVASPVAGVQSHGL